MSYSGITNASQISVTYDTSYQQLKIHHLYIWRDGKIIDYTKDLSIEILNNEHNLTEGIYNGTITAYDILEDVRKGDLIDFEYTLTGSNPIFEKEQYYFIPLEVSNQIDFYSIRFIYLKDKDYIYKCVDCDSIDFSSEIVDNYKEIKISLKDLKVSEYEDYMPGWTLPNKYFALTSFKSWKDVNSWAQSVFEIKKEPKFEDVFEEICIGEETLEEKINKIIDYVQDDIRYMGIETGIGSIKPYPPEQVVKQRFGDCKDKSLLLVSLLKKIGIEKAYPALVNVNMEHDLDKLYPSNEVFDHCIVTYEYNNKQFWVDPAIPLQGGRYSNIFAYNYGKALIVGLPSDSLHNIKPQQTRSGIDIIEEINVNSFTEPASLNIISKRYGMEADRRRSVLEYYSLNDITKSIVDEMKKIFPEVEMTSDPDILDDADDNQLTMTYQYKIDDFWQDGDKIEKNPVKGYRLFRFEPQTLYPYLSESKCEERNYDFALNYPLNLNYRVVFNFPKEMFIGDTYKDYENQAFLYS